MTKQINLKMILSCFFCSFDEGCCTEVHSHHCQWCQAGLWSKGTKVISCDTLDISMLWCCDNDTECRQFWSDNNSMLEKLSQ